MVYTVTFNPSIDYVVQVEGFQLGKVNRVNKGYKYPGGKGINVSRVLKNMNINSKALGFIGGFTGEYIKKYLEDEGIETDFITVKEDTRINIKLKSHEETEINGAGPPITEENIKTLLKKINKLTSKDYLVLAGNIQKSLSRDIYSKLQARCKTNKVKVVIDTAGEALIATLKNNPFLIKPNKEELKELFDAEINTKEEIVFYAKKLREMGAKNVIVSMAEDGALLICNEGIYDGSVPKGVVKNSVGAGDSLIAGFIASYLQKADMEEAFKWGIASGSATAFSLDLCKSEDVERLLDQVKINKI
ncbi:1-phosphofructokinase [Crassaminicella profunda]|uniref:1-phosphofructokinase n=1 Tax=Crassaminicella profunda TaxID=1286698 RepID=UPI001CA70375|nr:1-phosphofructokinase [Crassaminicella profunda]QZY57450.1 1-phosphofructokinase [Crassaminicella profunda]